MNIKEIRDKRKLQWKFNGSGDILPCLDCEHFDGGDYLPPCGHEKKFCKLFEEWRRDSFQSMSSQIAGVQPMSAPTGNIFTLKTVFLDDEDNQ